MCNMFRNCCIFLALVSQILKFGFCAPYFPPNSNYAIYQYRQPFYNYGFRQGIIHDWITNSDYFPVEVNVPDTVNGISSGWQTFWENIIQRFPFLNNWVNQQTPRPFKFIVLVPLPKVKPGPQSVYVPFEEDRFPLFP